MSNDQTKLTAKERELTSTLDAWKQYLPNSNEVIFFGGEELKVSDVGARLAGELGRHTRARKLEHEHHHAVTERNANVKRDRELHRNLESFVRTRLAKQDGALAAFGCVDVVPKQPSTETLAIAVVNRNRTRLKRHTMGKRQKEAITRVPKPTLVILGPDGKPLTADPSSLAGSDPDSGSKS